VKLAVRTLATVKVAPVDAVTLYPVIAEPPSEVGAVQVTVAKVLPATAETPVGAKGSVPIGVAEDEAESKELPARFVALTVNVTDVPLVNPLIVAINTFPTVTGLPTDGVTVYPVIVAPPSDVGAVHFTVADVLPGEATTAVGALGTVAKDGSRSVEILGKILALNTRVPSLITPN